MQLVGITILDRPECRTADWLRETSDNKYETAPRSLLRIRGATSIERGMITMFSMPTRRTSVFTTALALVAVFASPGAFTPLAVAQSENEADALSGRAMQLQEAQAARSVAPEVEEGWTTLFDGTSTDAWRGYRASGFPAQGWTVTEDGTLQVKSGGGGGDIITRDRYGDFELELEYKVSPRANSGIIYRVTERHGATWQTGPEFQVLDDAGHNLDPSHPHAAGAMYDLYSPMEGKVSRPAGEWNQVRILIENGRIEHWLNGTLVVEADMNDPDYLERIRKSKFNAYEGFGVEPRGHIALQDHGDDVWYRNIRIRDLDDPKVRGEALFNGRNTRGWEAWAPVTEVDVEPISAWMVDQERDVLICHGGPEGYLKTTEDYKNFILRLDWRYTEEAEPGSNSGVLVRMSGEDKLWPQCLEAQLMNGNAGDIILMGDYSAQPVEGAQRNGRRIARMKDMEREIGKWNRYEITCREGVIELKINGRLVNRVTDADVLAGPIALQSEGAPIEFRNIRIVDLDRLGEDADDGMPPTMVR